MGFTFERGSHQRWEIIVFSSFSYSSKIELQSLLP